MKKVRIPNQAVKNTVNKQNNISVQDAKTVAELTPEQKKELEKETCFILYLTKTKQATLVGKEFYVDGVLLSNISHERRKELYAKYENEQMLVLEFIMYGQLLREAMDQMDKNYYGNLSPVKTAYDVFKKKITMPIERDFSIVYKNGNNGERGVNESNEILKELEKQAKEMASFRVPAKAIMSRLNRAFNYDNDVMMGTADRIIKKYEKAGSGMKALETFLNE